jgi:alginate O-acetyltransferase complex protein AlgI
VNLFTKWEVYPAIAVAVVIVRLVGPSSKAARAVAVLLANVAFLSLLTSFREFAPLLAGYVAVVIALGSVVRRRDRGARSAFVAGIAFALGVLVTFKYGRSLAAHLSSEIGGGASAVSALLNVPFIPFVGLSYVAFRACDYLIQCRAGRVRPGHLTAVCYLTFFPTYVSGPINRFQSFQEDLAAADAPLTFPRVRADVLRISLGIIKMLFLARIAYENSIIAPDFARAPAKFWAFAVGVFAYLGYIYLDFSGYCDAAIGVADLLGFRIPENFVWPFLAVSIQDFWNRWHVTLSRFCRDYVFFPLLAVLRREVRALPALAAVCISVFVTFVLLGAWHGDAVHWVLYGCYHGAGLSIHQLWRASLDRLAPELLERLDASRVYSAACAVLTLNFVAWGLLLTVPTSQASALIARFVTGS